VNRLLISRGLPAHGNPGSRLEKTMLEMIVIHGAEVADKMLRNAKGGLK